MIFGKKKKRMIDVRELQKRGVVRIPRDDLVVPTNKDGFVEMGSKSPSTVSTTSATTSSNSSGGGDLFGFMDTPSGQTATTDQFSTQTDGYNKREVDAKIVDLDNKIYKLEQRVELLEKKLDVNPGSTDSTPPVGPAGW